MDTFRLLGKDDYIQNGDQALDDDCETWRDLVGWEAGCKYDPSIFVPMRRPAHPIQEREDGDE